MKTRIICRTIILNENKDKLLLARNRGAKFWYPPGGGLEESDINLKACAAREVKEEVGIDVEIGSLQYVQEFSPEEGLRYVEFFWLSQTSEADHDPSHIDLDPDGLVEEVKWISKEDLPDLKVFPKRIKNEFWREFEARNQEAIFLLD